MDNNKIKNTIVIKGMASNVVDEAIVILKPNVKLKKPQIVKNIKSKNNSKELILKEAEHIIEEYVNRIPVDELKNERELLIRKIKMLRLISLSFFILLVISVFLK